VQRRFEFGHRLKERSLQVDATLLGDDDNRPQEVRKFMLNAFMGSSISRTPSSA